MYTLSIVQGDTTRITEHATVADLIARIQATCTEVDIVATTLGLLRIGEHIECTEHAIVIATRLRH